jgi:hypothetical protein
LFAAAAAGAGLRGLMTMPLAFSTVICNMRVT